MSNSPSFAECTDRLLATEAPIARRGEELDEDEEEDKKEQQSGLRQQGIASPTHRKALLSGAPGRLQVGNSAALFEVREGTRHSSVRTGRGASPRDGK
jgi:hypothetical protein